MQSNSYPHSVVNNYSQKLLQANTQLNKNSFHVVSILSIIIQL